MNEIRKKILLDCCVTPFAAVPVMIGGTLLLLSAVLGATAGFIGFCACLLGVGAAVTNAVFNLEKISQRATKEWQQNLQRQRERELDDLDVKLASTPWKDDENALRNLRVLYGSFCRDFADGKISPTVPVSLLGQIDEIFNTCVIQLAKSLEVWQQSEEMAGNLKKQLLAQRKQMVADVEESIEQLGGVITEVRAMKWRAKRGELLNLQQKLQSQLNVARVIEERMVQLENGDVPTEERYSEYQS